MIQQQYTLIVTGNEITHEEGHFFKATPFTITVNNTTYSCNFEKGSAGQVVHTIQKENDVIAELIHPDYVPDAAPQDVNGILKTPDGDAIMAALLRIGISKEPKYQEHADALANSLSYQVSQKAFF